MSSIDQLIAQLKANSKLSGDGSVNGVFAVKWEFVVTVGLDKDEIESLDEESLRSALGAQVNEMVSMTREAGDAITIDALYEVRDGRTDEAIDFRIPESLASLKARISEILAD